MYKLSAILICAVVPLFGQLGDGGVTTYPSTGGGGGTGCVPAGSANQVLTDTGAGGCNSISGATIDSSGNFVTPGTITSGSGGLVAGAVQMGQGTAPTASANSFGWAAPATMTTSVVLMSPNAVPAANQVMLFPAPTSNRSQFAWTTLSTGGQTAKGTTTTVYHGNAAGDGSFGAVGLTTDVTGVLPQANGGLGTAKVAITAPATAGTIAFGGDSYTSTLPNGTVSQTIASGTSALGTSSISTASCATVVTTVASGVASTDAITWNPNGSIKAVTGYVPATTGGLTIAAYPTSGNVNFDVCNWTSGSITPGAVTINWRVVR